MLLEKDGSSNLAEQQKVLRLVIRLLKKYKLVVIGDRGFHSIELASWLQEQKVNFVLRHPLLLKPQAKAVSEIFGVGA